MGAGSEKVRRLKPYVVIPRHHTIFCICMAGSQRVNTSYKASLYAHSQLIQVVSIYLTYLNLMRHSNDIKWLQGLLGTIGLDSPANGAKCKSF